MQELFKEQVTAIDGCRKGWISCTWNPTSGWSLKKHSSIPQLYEHHNDRGIFLIDMPMGLPGRNSGRVLEDRLREKLRPFRHSSIFNPPAREVLYCNDHATASKRNRDILGKGLSIQSFNIIHGIKELDEFLQANPVTKMQFYECHPELCYRSLNGSPCKFSKHSAEGIELRKNLIGTQGPELLRTLNDFIEQVGRSFLKDSIDAAIMCLRGKLHEHLPVNVLKDPSICDENGIPMRIIY